MTGPGDMFPVRVLVETVRPAHCLGCAHDGNALVDTFAVVGGQTMLCQLVETVLAALGLPQLVQDSKGLIQINNWKPIAFETITDNPEELVANLFRDISTHITLKILAKRSPSEPNGQCLSELKQRLLKTAIEKQPQILTTSNGQEVKEILQQVIQGDQQCSAWTSREQTEAVNEWLEQMAAQQEDSRKSPLCTTRFSPICELPRLERWFRSEPNPSRQKLLSYMNLLNASPYRRANNKVTYQQICNWFINQRRTAQRQTLATRQSSSNPTAAPQKPMALLPLNATGGPAATTHQFGPGQANLALLNSLAAALANGSMDQAQVQQKMAALLSGMGEERNHLQLEQNHQIPLANGPPMDIRSKFDGNAEQEGLNGTAQEGQQGGHHSDRMDGGSESPTGNDDMSEHSGTSGCPVEAPGVDCSMACSPDELFMDVQQSSSAGSTQARPNEEQQCQQDSPEDGLQQHAQQHAAAGISLSQLLQPGQQTPPPSAMAAAAAAFSMVPTQAQLQLMNQLAMASQFQGLSPATPQPPVTFGASSGTIKSSPPMALREEANGAGGSGTVIKHESSFSSPSQSVNSAQNSNNSNNNNQSRSRLMFDPLSELPILERWFEENPHPGWLQIEQYTDYLNSMAYRQNYPPISTHNVKIWFKNRRAKTKRLLSNTDGSMSSTALTS